MRMLDYNPLHCLPSSAELPDSDDTPVENELQNLIPNLLEAMLVLAWADREDWFFGVDMGIYFAPSQPPLVPDGFLSLGVERFIDEEGRLSYVLWEEDDVVPTFVLEVVSKTYGGEYEQKQFDYAQLGVPYYAIYVPSRGLRRKRQRLEVYCLVEGHYVLQTGDRIWMPELGLSLGRERGTYFGRTREWLYWYDSNGARLITPEEAAVQGFQRAEQERQRAEQERQRAEQAEQELAALKAKLAQSGISLDD
jgi:Uma2 family endonuclease